MPRRDGLRLEPLAGVQRGEAHIGTAPLSLTEIHTATRIGKTVLRPACVIRLGRGEWLRRECPINGVTGLDRLVGGAGDDTASKVIAKAFNAGFHRIAQRVRPRPVGSRDRVTR